MKKFFTKVRESIGEVDLSLARIFLVLIFPFLQQAIPSRSYLVPLPIIIIMNPLRSVVALLLVSAVAAFAPAMPPAVIAKSTTSLSFGFLKELGLEKPDWLPDFGGEKKEEAPPAPVDAEASEEDAEAEAVATEE